MELQLIGKIIIKGDIKVLTGLRIGGLSIGLKIGGVDLNVVKDAEGKPYIPGSSLKGKLRNLLERKKGKIEGEEVHKCKNDQQYNNCAICKIFGISTSEKEIQINSPTLTRIIVRDVSLNEESLKEIMDNLELEYTEVKVENVINRIKGSAEHPRHIERVPAGAVFSPMEIILSIYKGDTLDLILKPLLESMALLEHDYLGGMGSRGYGKVRFENLEIYWNKKEDYEKGELNKNKVNDGLTTVEEIIKNFENLKNKIGV